MKVNFKQFPVWQGITKKSRITMDLSEPLANCIYSSVPGIKAHVLAEKIYKGDADVELEAEEVAIIRNITSQLAGMYADSINDHFNELDNLYNNNNKE